MRGRTAKPACFSPREAAFWDLPAPIPAPRKGVDQVRPAGL